MADRLERKLSPRLLPKLSSEVDFSSLDNQAVDVFLSSFSSNDKANVTKHMTKQLKALRALLSLTSHLSASATVSNANIRSIMEQTSSIICSEKVFLLDIDRQEGNLVVSYSPENSFNGTTTAIDKGIEGYVISQKKGRVMNDLSSSALINDEFYKQLNVIVKNLISVPIMLGDTVIGLIVAFNKQADDFNFSNFDMSCLETIAVNLAVLYRCAVYTKVKPSTGLLVGSPTSVTTQSQLNAEFDSILKDIVDDSYRLLGADRISVFVDNGNHELLCISSQDIKGAVVSPSEGFVGECFRKGTAFNIPNCQSDDRHYRELDEKIGFKTQGLLCVPLIGIDSDVLGVMQALNREGGDSFTDDHVAILQHLGYRISVLLSRIKSLISQKCNPNITIIRNLGDFSSQVYGGTPMIPTQLVDIVQKYGRNIAQCDRIYYFKISSRGTEGSIVLESVSDTDCASYQEEDIHPKVRESLSTKVPTEVCCSDSDSHGYVLPGIEARCALIVPLTTSHTKSQHPDLLIMTRKQKLNLSENYSPEDSAISLENVFINVVNSISRTSFSALESQGLISLANMFSTALNFSCQANVESNPDRISETSSTRMNLDYPGALSSFCAEDRKELSRLFDWNFNVLNMKDKNALHYAVLAIFDKGCSFADMKIDRNKVYKYILEVDSNYLENPFHNFYHAVCVTHFDFMLLNITNGMTHLSPIMMFASLLSALVHDVSHPGNTNMYEINMRSKLAVLYNDTSVLENHHCSTAFRLMNIQGLGIFDEIEFGLRAEIRKMMIACIIATDMHYHVSLIELISNRAAQAEWHIDSFTERMNYGKILLHAADLSNPTRIFETSRAWAERVSEEFNAQGKLEKENGIPVSTFLLSHDLKSFVKNELFFSGHIVFPMWKELIRLYPHMSHITDQIASNLESWKALIK